MEYASSTLVKD